MSVAVLQRCYIFHWITIRQFELLQLLLPIRTERAQRGVYVSVLVHATKTSKYISQHMSVQLLNMLYTFAFPCIVLSSTPWWLFRPLNTAGKSLSVSTSLQSRWSSTPGTGNTPWLCGKPPGWPTFNPFRWKSRRCFSPSASFRLLKVTVLILPSLRWYRKVATKREKDR